MDIEPKQRTFRWLHLSDLHVGARDQANLWPRFKTLLFDDLTKAIAKSGAFDVVVFSGDLVNKGEFSEFEALDELLFGLIGKLGELGPKPKIITVPGNHDLSRPSTIDPLAIALTQFWNRDDIRVGMWADPQPYITFLKSRFENYSSWKRRAIASGLHCMPTSEGILPGDASYVLTKGHGRLGVACLNSTWLQLGGGDYERELHVDARQLLAITNGSPDDWANLNDANLLVTHQPSEWLHSTELSTWENDIDPANRFDAHLFGHMHEPKVTTTSFGGGDSKRRFQASSLFGLESYGTGLKRIQGYSYNQLKVSPVERTITVWPRRLTDVIGGGLKLTVDQSQNVQEETSSYSLAYKLDRAAGGSHLTPEHPAGVAIDTKKRLTSETFFDLSSIQKKVEVASGHLNVRKVEQQTCLLAFQSCNPAWLISDWGMGESGYIFSICQRHKIPLDAVFSIDLHGFDGTLNFIDDFRTRFGATLEQICDALTAKSLSLLILSDVDSSVPMERIEAIVEPIRDFLPDTCMILQSHDRPALTKFPVIELKAFDEPDAAIYVRESKFGSIKFAKPSAISTIFGITDGVPERLDEALRSLEFVSIDDLVAMNPDYSSSRDVANVVPPTLALAVADLSDSANRDQTRAFALLLALSALPQGEQLMRLTRFFGVHPIYISHAQILLERSLIELSNITALDGMPGQSHNRRLIVPRSVRDHVRAVTDQKVLISIDSKALELYFGNDWKVGDIKTSPLVKRLKQRIAERYELHNAGTLILRAIRQALDDDNTTDLDNASRIALAYAEALIVADSFRIASIISNDFVRLLEPSGDRHRRVNNLRLCLAKSLRMTGQLSEAARIFEALDLSTFSTLQRQSAELGLALTRKSQGENQEAVSVANRVIAIDAKSSSGLQARTILAEDVEDPALRRQLLQQLLALAKSSELITVQNNILLKLSADESDDQKALILLEDVLNPAINSSDLYNRVRAIVNFALKADRHSNLSEPNLYRLYAAYQFLYNERLGSLFDRCHDALWNEFQKSNDVENLLNLFRHSSFVWRLSGKDKAELTYFGRLAIIIKANRNKDDLISTRNRDYYIGRAHTLGPSIAPDWQP